MNDFSVDVELESRFNYEFETGEEIREEIRIATDELNLIVDSFKKYRSSEKYSFIPFQQYCEEMIASPETDENEVETDRIDTANTNIKVDSADIVPQSNQNPETSQVDPNFVRIYAKESVKDATSKAKAIVASASLVPTSVIIEKVKNIISNKS